MMSHTWERDVNTHIQARYIELLATCSHVGNRGARFTEGIRSHSTETHAVYVRTHLLILVSTADLDACQTNREIKTPHSCFRVTGRSFEAVIQVVFQST